MENLNLNRFYETFPLMRLFSYDNKMYAYDSKSSFLVEVEESDMIDLLNAVDDNKTTCQKLSVFKVFFNKGVFLPYKLKKIIPNNDELMQHIEKDLSNIIPRKLIIEVTQDCNLRCKYCLFSDNSSPRVHNKDKMSMPIAQKAIDFYFKTYTDIIKNLSEDVRKKVCSRAVPNLSWWGGEPLLNFDLIKNSKLYFESLPWDKFGIKRNELVYSVVTNLTIFTPEIMDFIVSNNVYLFVSIDGDKEQHDKNRVFNNNHGSFNTVNTNLHTLINLHPEYCKKRVCLQAVQADNIDIREADQYLVGHFSTKVLKCVSYEQKYWGESKLEEKTHQNFKYNLEYYKQMFELIERMSENEINDLLDSKNDYYAFFKGVISLESLLSFDNPRGSNDHYRMFSCPIGRDVLFYSTNGQLHICNKTDYSFSIGNINDGINKKKIHQFYQNYHNAINQKCISCWAFRLCKLCPAVILDGGTFKKTFEEYCVKTKNILTKRIYSYIILSNYPHAFNYISKYCKKRSRDESSFLTFEGPVNINNFNSLQP